MILDTNALSALAEGDPAIEPILRQAMQIGIPVVVLGEYRFGIAQSRERKNYESWLAEYLDRFRILDVTDDTSQRYAEVRLELKKAGKPIPANDLWIAALCRQHRLPILSRDGHFDAVQGLKRIGW
ncbi:MAG TPA: type II toxin-antitoxin system VapC family toxin [Acidobacteriaceae bacterium]|nr:type II toxin-antitoxin system VapC family toxin [Acidobacteriaceae bacterium]